MVFGLILVVVVIIVLVFAFQARPANLSQKAGTAVGRQIGIGVARLPGQTATATGEEVQRNISQIFTGKRQLFSDFGNQNGARGM